MELAGELGAALLGSAGDAIIAADAEGVIRFWNPGAERIFVWRDNLDENGAVIRTRSGGRGKMVAPNPDRCKALVTMP